MKKETWICNCEGSSLSKDKRCWLKGGLRGRGRDHESVFDLDEDKAQSLDGFFMLFYHDCWDTIKTYLAKVFNRSNVSVIFGKALTSLFSCWSKKYDVFFMKWTFKWIIFWYHKTMIGVKITSGMLGIHIRFDDIIDYRLRQDT